MPIHDEIQSKAFTEIREEREQCSVSLDHPVSQSVQLLSLVQLFLTPWTAAHQASRSITNSQSFLKLMSIELVMPVNRLILCCPLFLENLIPFCWASLVAQMVKNLHAIQETRV